MNCVLTAPSYFVFHFLDNMAGRFLGASLLILIVVFKQGSSSVLNDPDQLEGDTYTTADVADDLADLNDLEMEQVQDSVPLKTGARQRAVCKEIQAEFKAVEKKSMAEAKKEKPDSLISRRQAAYRASLRKSFQILQHGKRSVVDDSIVLRSLQNEACVKCAIRNICETKKVLNLLGISLNMKRYASKTKTQKWRSELNYLNVHF